MKILFISLTTLLFVACAPQNDQQRAPEEIEVQAGEYVDLSPSEMVEMVKQKPGTVLDVRTPQETAEGVIEGAVVNDFYEDSFADRLNELDKNQPVYVYCAAGGRSSDAAEMMVESGFTEVYNLDGGMREWKKQNMPTTNLKP